MALKVELKPGERIIVGDSVITNDNQRTRLFIEGTAPILREKDILTVATANSPAHNCPPTSCHPVTSLYSRIIQ